VKRVGNFSESAVGNCRRTIAVAQLPSHNCRRTKIQPYLKGMERLLRKCRVTCGRLGDLALPREGLISAALSV
jgi:hypothetical protein